MSHKLLDALMHLFAILANAEKFSLEGRSIVESFLRQQISRAYVLKYLGLFDEYLENIRGKATEGKLKKRLSVNSVKVLRICTDINAELDTRQKHIVLMRLIEFVFTSEKIIDSQEKEFLYTVAEVFHIAPDDVQLCIELACNNAEEKYSDTPKYLVLSSQDDNSSLNTKTQIISGLNGVFRFLFLKNAGLLFVRYHGDESFTLNGLPLNDDLCYVFSAGSVIRGSKVNTIYYTDIIRLFSNFKQQSLLHFDVQHVYYDFSNGKRGLNDVAFSATSGNLVGIMGGSGAGKSTLLNILNGNNRPTQGKVTVNGIDLHRESHLLEGMIGYVPQDDLLIEELTVYQNLFYNAKLCFGNLTDSEIDERVKALLLNVGLSEASHLRVGNALSTSISGGQRKRLNIALELIRAPEVLFVDEPTSGLSSLDSENVMDLLKQLANHGKLVFVVIHQPSSDIFKMFDKLFVLDIGGYPAYFGNPVDSLLYFKQRASFADADYSECGTCGNINPEQIFSILESKVMDEFGFPTQQRKLTPADWYQLFKEHNSNSSKSNQRQPVQGSANQKPGWLQQLKVYMTRDMLSKFKNKQYMLITFLEAPVLAIILAWFLRYFNPDGSYVFSENKNLVAFLFMAVIVAIFMGLTVSAEEIIRDRKMLKREKFLNLSRSSYLYSKMMVMFLISAIQTFSFVIIGNLIFGIQSMTFDYWIMLFSVSCFANMLGLNVSSMFDSAVTIYILIPFLIIPQIILSGVMVKFEDLNPHLTSQRHVPLIGELMASRWAFEALAVNQFSNNPYQKYFFNVDRQMSEATYKKDFWLQKLNDIAEGVSKNKSKNPKVDVELITNELHKEALVNKNFKTAIDFTKANASEIASQIKPLTDILRNYYIEKYNNASAAKDSFVKKELKHSSVAMLNKQKEKYTNNALNDLVLNKNDFTILVQDGNSIVQRFQPVYMQPDPTTWFRSPLYVYEKNFFGMKIHTWYVNLFIIWLMSFILMTTLYFDSFRKLIHWVGHSSKR
ncbi:MAG TPA: ATP-binding cassette domain-containing protein [Bacteroidia bacterium]|nr:ATP-binding cassette domain-containing protein [Bacteroidia bacterium]OQB59399.1 MAG: ABC transporter ATP-binding/permease protein [Bacteroidetes bacterium ADurb.Bin141]MBP7713129.1 ATP-binding cassette domain-containing protein [Bacteroidia bacterium]MBP8668957.1 ATP-binding cassette domain-containing protein [Bacteroidia bacterium]HOZ81481.1 ATP-binding cassette domain-containing protein [Bacteroidia bacterium]